MVLLSVCVCTEMSIEYLVSVFLLLWSKIDVQEVMSGQFIYHWRVIAGNVYHTSLNIAAQPFGGGVPIRVYHD